MDEELEGLYKAQIADLRSELAAALERSRLAEEQLCTVQESLYQTCKYNDQSELSYTLQEIKRELADIKMNLSYGFFQRIFK